MRFGQDVEFVIEGTEEEPTLAMVIDGKEHPVKHTLLTLPVSGSIEKTVADFKRRFPEDRVTVKDKRIPIGLTAQN